MLCKPIFLEVWCRFFKLALKKTNLNVTIKKQVDNTEHLKG